MILYIICVNVFLGDIMYKHININLMFDEMINDVEYIKRKIIIYKKNNR